MFLPTCLLCCPQLEKPRDRHSSQTRDVPTHQNKHNPLVPITTIFLTIHRLTKP